MPTYIQRHVVGVDLAPPPSGTSQRKYSIDLALHRLPLEQIGSLGIAFDFIACHGVLHHLADPVAGLCALRDVLKPDGVATLMVYAKYGRLGVYMLQDFFRLLGLQQDAAGVADVQQTLSLLSPNHPLQHYLRAATDLYADAGLVDTFLHPRDRAYSVRDCLNLVSSANMVFQGWEESMPYNCDLPFAKLPAESGLRQRMAALSEEQIWEAAELFRGNIPVHFFYACRADRDPRGYRIHFEGEDFQGYIPVPRFARVIPGNPQQGPPNGARRFHPSRSLRHTFLSFGRSTASAPSQNACKRSRWRERLAWLLAASFSATTGARVTCSFAFRRRSEARHPHFIPGRRMNARASGTEKPLRAIATLSARCRCQRSSSDAPGWWRARYGTRWPISIVR